MRRGKGNAALRVGKFLFILACMLSLGGCALFDWLGGGVAFNTTIDGTLTFDDEYSIDSNNYYFYWDDYEITLDASKSYSLELWTDADCPIHFECDPLGEDLGAWSDGDGSWDGYLLYDFPAGYSGKVGFDFYLRSDYVGTDSWYQFRINEE